MNINDAMDELESFVYVLDDEGIHTKDVVEQFEREEYSSALKTVIQYIKDKEKPRQNKKHPLLWDRDCYKTPRHLIDSINYARQEIDYSNYDTNHLDMAVAIIRAYSKAEGIPIGPTREAMRKKEEKRQAAQLDKSMEKFAHLFVDGDWRKEILSEYNEKENDT